MASGRSAKRARKKERRNARQQQWRSYARKRRRQRWGVFLGTLGTLAVVGLVAVLVFTEGEETPSATPSASPKAAGGAACDAKRPKAAGSEKKQYKEPKDQDLDPDKTYIWRLETSCGRIDVELDLENAPKTSNSVAFLTRERFYDGLVFHRVVPDFVIQGGDPEGTGAGGSGYEVVEAPPKDLKYEPGVVAMAKGGPDPAGTSGSQFFIVTGAGGSSLPADYALLGEVVKGEDVAAKIEANPGGDGGQPPPNPLAYIERATIVEK